MTLRGPSQSPYRILIPFATPTLYGLERTTIETFDSLRPDVLPQFVQAESIVRQRLPIIEELERRGLQFTVLSDGDGWPRIRRREWNGQSLRMVRALLGANWFHARAVRTSDALCLTGAYGAVFAVAAAACCRLAGKPVIHQLHEWTSTPGSRLLNALVTDYFHNTAAGRDVTLRVDPKTSRKRHWVTPPVVNVEALPSSERLLTGGHIDIVFVGQVSPHKGVDLLLDAFARVAPFHRDAVLHVVGGCQDEFLPVFRSLCERTGCADQIKYWGYRSDGRVFLRDAYCCVQSTPPSRCLESFGRTVVEAMAFGVPSVCFGSGALSEIVKHGETGLLCDESAEALAAGMRRFLEDRAFRDRCGAQALRRFNEQFGMQAVRAKWLHALDGVARSSCPA